MVVAKCIGENIFIYEFGKIYTPDADEDSRASPVHPLSIAKGLGYEVVEGLITRF